MKENSLNTDSKSPTVLSFREVRQIYGDLRKFHLKDTLQVCMCLEERQTHKIKTNPLGKNTGQVIFCISPPHTCLPPELIHFFLISGGKKQRFCVWQLCLSSGKLKNSNSNNGGKEVWVMSNRGKNRSGGRVIKKEIEKHLWTHTLGLRVKIKRTETMCRNDWLR